MPVRIAIQVSLSVYGHFFFRPNALQQRVEAVEFLI